MTAGSDNALLQQPPRVTYTKLLKQGWTDAIRKTYPRERIYTFWDYKRNRWPRNAGLRIDLLLSSNALAPALKGAGVDVSVREMEGASDHAPDWMKLYL